MPQPIFTKFHGPTATKPARYSASAEAGRVYVSASDAQRDEANGPGWHGLTEGAHRHACMTLLRKMGWRGDYVGAFLPNGGMVWAPIAGPRCTRIEAA